LQHTRHQAALIYVNAYDHLLTLARALDGSMPLFSHLSVSRIVSEAAVRFAWLMDPDISSYERIVRGAVALYDSADQRLKGVRRLSMEQLGQQVFKGLLDNCVAEREEVEKVIAVAGLTFGYSPDGKTRTRLKLESANIWLPLKLNVSDLMAALLLDSPGWYNIGSSVTHSHYWGLRDVNSYRPGGPLKLTPNVLDIGAAAESAISASSLIIDRCGRCYGHDPNANVQLSRDRREAIDALMLRATRS
jgi:hypothetical protein